MSYYNLLFLIMSILAATIIAVVIYSDLQLKKFRRSITPKQIVKYYPQNKYDHFLVIVIELQGNRATVVNWGDPKPVKMQVNINYLYPLA